MLPRFDSINLLFFIYFFFCCAEGRKLNQRESEKSRRLHSSNFKFVMKTNKKKTSDQAVKHGETNGARERVTKTEKQEELNTTLIIPLRLLCVVYFFFLQARFHHLPGVVVRLSRSLSLSQASLSHSHQHSIVRKRRRNE